MTRKECTKSQIDGHTDSLIVEMYSPLHKLQSAGLATSRRRCGQTKLQAIVTNSTALCNMQSADYLQNLGHVVACSC